LKHLLTDNESKFDQEIEQLKRFGGQHKHIVTLLSTISLTTGNHKDFYLLFPWADSDLLGYWERHSKPNLSEELWLWLIEQCYGIVEAVAFIHNPGNAMKNLEGKRLYGRHGDIKPENVLWFIKRQSAGGRGALVLSDLGLAAVHRDTSRSNIPGEAIPRTPNYRPPECDMDGPNGHISRSFDIWTMGCLFLEFIIWALEGWDGRVDFRFSRCESAYLNGETDVFFDIKRTEKESAKSEYVFQVKDAVTKVCNSTLTVS
jgi:serine/threonine protein kinase